jgi:hypothetical protein
MSTQGARSILQVKETVAEKFMTEEELEQKRKEEARKKRWGPFGIFPGGK